MSTGKVHLMAIRLKNNAGMRFPLCYSYAKLLDTSKKSHLLTSPTLARVTCAHCRRIARENNSAYVNGAI